MPAITNTFSSVATGDRIYASRIDESAPSVWTHAATVSGAGAVSATVIVEGSNSPDVAGSWFTLATLTPSGAISANDAITGSSACIGIRHRCTAVAGGSVVATSFGA